jgi:glyoxylase-like metal-dependent hydrolase (beta-lactamase superfamily II)
VGGNRSIQEISGAEIAMHEYEAYYINLEDRWATWEDFVGWEFPHFKVDILLKEGDVIDADGFHLEVMHTPGHSLGGISLYSPEYGFLISGEAVMNGSFGEINPLVEGSSAPFIVLSTIEVLRRLEVKIIYPGHGGIITNPIENFERCLKLLKGFLNDPEEMVYHFIRSGFLWTLKVREGIPEQDLLDYARNTPLFVENNKRYFKGPLENLLERLLQDLKRKKVISIVNGIVRAVK